MSNLHFTNMFSPTHVLHNIRMSSPYVLNTLALTGGEETFPSLVCTQLHGLYFTDGALQTEERGAINETLDGRDSHSFPTLQSNSRKLCHAPFPPISPSPPTSQRPVSQVVRCSPHTQTPQCSGPRIPARMWGFLGGPGATLRSPWRLTARRAPSATFL